MEIQSPNAIERKWWESKPKDAHGSVFSLCTFLRKHQKERRRMNRLHMRIVSNDDPAGRGYYGTAMDVAKTRLEGGTEKSRYMLCLSIVDTAESIIASAKPTLQYLTTAGDWELQRKAKKRTQALAGQMRNLKIEELGPRAFRDAAINDIGGLIGYLHPETRKPCLQRFLPNEMFCDHNEAIHGDPRNLYRAFPANRERMKELYPKFAEKLDKAEGVSVDDRDDWYLTRESAADSVLVMEAWHLGPTGKKGRHVICVSNATLIDEPYKHQEFPVVVLRYEDSPLGWYGQSLVSRTKEAQRRVNKIIRRYERCQDLLSKSMVAVPRSSGLTPEQITNAPGDVVMCEINEPKLLVWNGTPPDLRQEIPAIREETLQNEGLSEQQVNGEMMSGVKSAVGIRAADDVQNRRHVQKQRRYERFHLEVAELLGRLNDDASEIDPSYTVTSQVRRGRKDYIHETPWKDVQIESEDARISVFPTSSLSTTPKGRRDDVMGLLQANLIDQQAAIELLDLPDLDTETANQLAEIDWARWKVERVIDDEDDGFIDPILGVPGLQLCLDTARKQYIQLSYNEAPEEVLDRLRDFMQDLKTEIDRLSAAAPQPTQATPDQQQMAGAQPSAPQPGAPQAPMPMPASA